jgi:hypothetical protein
MSSEKGPARRRASTSYEVGYCKPPMHTRFQPGKSGNPKGRPKSSCDLTAALREVLSETVEINEGERRRRRTLMKAFLRATVGYAVKGNQKATAHVIAMMYEAKLNVPPPLKKRREGPPSEKELAEAEELLALMKTRSPEELAQIFFDAQDEEDSDLEG